MKKFIPYTLIIILVALFLVVIKQAQAGAFDAYLQKNYASKISPELQSQLTSLQNNGPVTVIVTLKDQYRPNISQLQQGVNVQQAVIEGLQSYSQVSQAGILTVLQDGIAHGRVDKVTPFWIFNGFSITASADMIQELANRDDVASITPDTINVVPVSGVTQSVPANNLTVANIPALWNLGYFGQNVVVASLDTGVDLSHPELGIRWRGGSNSWYDPYNQHPSTPVDLNGHGTWTMGVMVAGDGSGTALGVAPQAQWIAAKIFDDSNSATATGIHLAFQWLLDPDGNPATADAPRVVNNSWAFGSPGCNLEFQNDLSALRLVGILPVFAAGNYGPGSSTSVSPANYPEAFSVGAVDNSGILQAYSSRGPSACGETSSIYPELVAPGAYILTTDLFGLYTQASGTSLSAPHITGSLALLLSAFPNISAETQAAALMNSALDLGTSGPDNDFGYGMLDALAAYNWLAAGNQVTPTPSPTATPIPTPTPSPTPTASPDAIFADGFESGDFGLWSTSVTDGGRLTVTKQAALDGTYGMQAAINNTTPIYVADTSPNNEISYHARFYFSPNSVSLPKNKVQDLFIGRTSSGEVIFKIQLQPSSGGYKIRGVILAGNGRAFTTSWYTLSNTTHMIELAWQAATSSGGSDGWLNLWLDESLIGTRGGIANGGFRLNEVWLGALAVPPGSSGIEYFDAFASTRTTYIGP